MTHSDKIALYSSASIKNLKDKNYPIPKRGNPPKIQDMRQDIQSGAINEKSKISLRSEIELNEWLNRKRNTYGEN